MTVQEPATLFGLPLSEAKQRIGRLQQLAGIEAFEETEGVGRGSRRLVLTSGGGLVVHVHPDRALDIGAVTYRGIPISWHSPTGFPAPGLTTDTGTGWLRSFGGGLLATCGLDAYGPPSATADGRAYPMHGRVGSAPGVVTQTRVTDDEILVEGEVRQAAVFGENLVLRRKIRIPIGGSTLAVEDTVTNEAAVRSGHMVLYHVNFGWPLVDVGAQLEIPSNSVSPRDAAAERGLGEWFRIGPPKSGYAEQVFRHNFSGQGATEVSLDNPAQDVRVRMMFDAAVLPALHQWKMLGEGHYVLGLEPTNVDWSRGRAEAEAAGVLPMLEPGESVNYRLEFECGPSRMLASSVEGGGI